MMSRGGKMDCEEYRTKHPEFGKLPLPRSVWDTPEWTDWMDHSLQCRTCSDWSLYQQVKARGHNPDDYPCVHIADQLTWLCDQHPDPNDCADVVIVHDKRFDEYAIPTRTGDSSRYLIRFCPWCGVRLPDSKRNRWFDELAGLGFDNPAEQDIPEKYNTDAWYRTAA
jgi:hypothetical protein